MYIYLQNNILSSLPLLSSSCFFLSDLIKLQDYFQQNVLELQSDVITLLIVKYVTFFFVFYYFLCKYVLKPIVFWTCAVQASCDFRHSNAAILA